MVTAASPSLSSPALLSPGQMIGNYRIVRPLGEGGMGVVFLAEHQHIARKAAVKVLHPDLSKNPIFAARFLTEARAVNLVRHPGLVEIFEFGQTEGGTAFIIMELIEGESLGERLKRAGRPLPPPAALALGRYIALAVAAAHGKGITHRDLKPDNVMIVPDPERPGHERIKLLDFGVAKLSESDAAGMQKTSTGVALGTPAYMSPEQCLGSPEVGPRADVYALGVILYQMLAGRLPFLAELAFDMMAMHVRQAPTPLLEVAPEVPQHIAALIHEMLDKDAESRPDMGEVAARLEESAGGLTDALPLLRAAAAAGPSGAGASARKTSRFGPGSVLRRRAPWLAAGSLLLALTAGGAGWYAWLRAKQAKEPAWVLIGEKGDRPPWLAPPTPAQTQPTPPPAQGQGQGIPSPPAQTTPPPPAAVAQQGPRVEDGKGGKKKRPRERTQRRKRGAKKDAGGQHGDP